MKTPSLKFGPLVKTCMLAVSLLAAAPNVMAQSAALNAGNSIADLVEIVSPAVVNIVVTTDDGETTSEGQGSGFVISKDGEVVTNYHVIDGGDQIAVVFNNGISFPAEIIGTDEETDLALLKVHGTSDFPAVKWYQGPPIRIGDWVVAIGNPFGIGQSTSLGIISAIGRDRVESGAYVDYIQTDATINRGNSGGPLFNPQGTVIGVNSAIFSPTGASVGIGFSIPHQTAEEVISAIRKDGRVRRGWLGVGLREVEYSSGRSGGANINNVIAGSPAHLAGLQIDDIIFKINDQFVTNSVEATRMIGELGPDVSVNMQIERNEQEMSVTLQMVERPSKDEVDRAMASGTYSTPESYNSTPTTPSAPSSGPSLGSTGLMLVDLSASFRQSIGMRYDQVGVYVEGVVPGSSAAGIGIKANMVLLSIDQNPIASVSEFRTQLRKAGQAGQNEVLLLVRLENGSENYTVLPITASAYAGTASYDLE